MRWRASVGVALRRLRERPVRTLLLLQGTVWGVAVAIFPSAVVQGTREAVRTQGARLGADRIAVAADPTGARRTALRRADLARLAAALAAAGLPLGVHGAVRVVPRPTGSDGPGAGAAGQGVTLLAATPGAEAARGLMLAAGRWLRPGEGPGTCVVEAGVAAALGRDTLAPGDRLVLPGRGGPLEVVGVAAPRAAEALRTNDLGFDLAHPVYERFGRHLLLALGIPLVQDAWKRSERCVVVPLEERPDAAVDWLFLRVAAERVAETAARVRETFARDGRAVATLYPLVLPIVTGSQVERFEAVQLAMFLACLFMGAVVMMNLGLLNVLGRSREIAIVRTEGATAGDIARQFLVEGGLLAVVGSLLGWGLGMLLARLRVSLEPVTGFAWAFPWGQALQATAVAVTIGLLAYVLPAWKAARGDPVEGLADD